MSTIAAAQKQLSESSAEFNPLKLRGVNWLHFAIQVKPTFLISDIQK